MKTDSSHFWRSLDEFKHPEKFRADARDEFVSGASELNNLDRRAFLKLMGASLALASLPACTRQPVEKIVPYVQQPEQLVPGKPQFYATAMTLGGFTTGLLVESHEGHPTKIEGNPDHPASLGATNVFHQAAILDLYDPDRSQSVLKNGQPNAWDSFVSTLNDVLAGQASVVGKGLRILTETITSPTLAMQIQSLLKKFPQAKWHQFEPLNRDAVYAGAKLAFGEIVETQYRFDEAKIILSLESDFLYLHPQGVRHARDFAKNRRAGADEATMSRLYVAESSPSVTGSNADHRLPINSGDIERFALALAQKLGVPSQVSDFSLNGEQQKWLSALVDDLAANKGASIIIAGENQPANVHALVHLLNHTLGNFDRTIWFTEPAAVNAGNQATSLHELVQALGQDEVDVLIVLGGNPVFTSPADWQFAKNFSRAKFRVHLSADLNETSTLSHWHIPQNHFLESWSDGRSYDGTLSVVQPLILPLYAGKSVHEVLDAMLQPPGRIDYDIVHDYWASQNANADFENDWRQALHDGCIKNSAFKARKVSIRTFQLPSVPPIQTALEITFRPDSSVYDGRFANNGWLQELPRRITKLVWDNAALISPALAQGKNLVNGDMVELTCEGRKISIPVWITPGQAEKSIGLTFGYGRENVGRVGSGSGFNVYPLRNSDSLWFAKENIKLVKTVKNFPLVTTQTQHVIDSEERQIFRETTLSDLVKNPDLIQKNSESPGVDDTLFDPKEFNYDGYRWGMSIDLSACIGCNACTLACQSENNIPVVGKKEVSRGRVMHWIRVDDYFSGAPANPTTTHQPVPCMHCENAPCELVCPVGATLHDKEGLNLQVYNRCIGTRYCSNNCPYKVRRFNFFQYADYQSPSLKPMWNPNVTVRWRGVMEKCTYCIQRISIARINSEEQGRKIRDGEIKTACQQVCPAQAIVFGDISDPQSRVSQLKSQKLNFLMLGELNTRPRTSYLAKVRNPHPSLA